MKKYLLNGLAALTMGFAMTSCMQEFNVEVQEQQVSLDNAQQTLGFYIPENQDWVMTSTATATFNIQGLSDEATVYVFSNNPQSDGYGSVLASGQTTGTTTTLSEFSIPAHLESVFVGVKESNGNMIYKYVDVENGQINANYNYSTTANARTRSITVNGDTYSAFTFPSSSDLTAAFPTSVPTNADEVADLETLYKGQTYGGTTMWDLYAIYANKIVEGYNLKVTRTGVVELGGNYQNAGWNGSANVAYPYNVYVNVNGDVTIRRVGATHFNLYILKGNVTLESNYGEQAGSISVAAGATLNDQRNSIAANQGIKIFNRGTINATNTEKYDIGNFCTVYNEGKFNFSGAMTYSPGDANTSYFINMGDNAEITAPSMTMNSSCHFYNSGKVTVSGETKVTQQKIYWINNGHYTTGSMTFSAKNTTFYNYCQLLVKGNAHMYDGEFNLMNGSYTETNTADFDNFIVNMNGNAGFNVKDGSDWAAQGDGTFQGFKATGTNNYVRLGGTTTVAGHLKSLETTGNITLAYNNIVDLGAGNSGVQPTYQFNEGTTKVNFSQLNPTYNSTNCGASWTSNPPVVTPVTENQTWTYAFEDNKTRCDFDLNDVVIQVRESETNSSKLIVTLVAAGCEYDNYVWLGNTQLSWNNKAEVHEAFGATHGVMVNTSRGVDMNAVETTIDKPSGFDFQTADFKICPFKVNSDPTVSTNAVNDYITVVTSSNSEGLGKVPLGIAIPAKWKWPKERVVVNNAYSGFTAWGKQSDLTLKAGQSGWYQTPNSGTVYGE
ncbi:DUF4842 domain-containing protein [Xylanibacter ruminicola]|uniref:DUF4842 domain-containing protein n=1 Tax=Xylanibacter ruminicola TaxID=839 RepID=UPI0012D2F4D2|nr:DUF4842 domain-containing protein [Xylanibacter ruminicola]